MPLPRLTQGGPPTGLGDPQTGHQTSWEGHVKPGAMLFQSIWPGLEHLHRLLTCLSTKRKPASGFYSLSRQQPPARTVVSQGHFPIFTFFKFKSDFIR